MERLETIEIDIQNKKFEINHTPISKNCSGLTIKFDNGVWSVSMTEEFAVRGSARALRNEFSNEVGNLQ